MRERSPNTNSKRNQNYGNKNNNRREKSMDYRLQNQQRIKYEHRNRDRNAINYDYISGRDPSSYGFNDLYEFDGDLSRFGQAAQSNNSKRKKLFTPIQGTDEDFKKKKEETMQ